MDAQTLLNTNIKDLLEWEAIPQEQQEAFLGHVVDLILARVARRIKDQLPEEEKAQYLALFSDSSLSSEEKRTEFLQAHVPNFGDLLLQEILLCKAAAAGKLEEFLSTRRDDKTQQ